MPKQVNPRGIAAPQSRYSHGVVHSARSRRVVISGQVGMRMDGTVPEDLAEQIELAFDNLFAVVREAGMGPTDIIRITAYATEPGTVAQFRQVRDRKLNGHATACTYLQVAGLASPAFRFELEGEAVSEEPDMIFDEIAEDVQAGMAAGWGKK
jgi:2-iminobutanoate/2-iminopropanoate deaminase